MSIRAAAISALEQREQADQATLADAVAEHNIDQLLANAHSHIKRVNKDARPKNTKLAYETKQQEFYDYCKATTRNRNGQNIFLIEPNKVYDFMLYVAFRSKRKSGRQPENKKRNAEGELIEDDEDVPRAFNYQEYREVHARLAALSDNSGLLAMLPPSPLQHQAFNTYRSALKNIHADQHDVRGNSWTWEAIWGKKCQDLHQHVKKRRKIVAKVTHQEKMDSSIELFMGVDQDKVIEESMWQQSQKASNLRWVLDKIRYVKIWWKILLGLMFSNVFGGTHKKPFFILI